MVWSKAQFEAALMGDQEPPEAPARSFSRSTFADMLNAPDKEPMQPAHEVFPPLTSAAESAPLQKRPWVNPSLGLESYDSNGNIYQADPNDVPPPVEPPSPSFADYPNSVRALKKAAASDVGINEQQFGPIGVVSDQAVKRVTNVATNAVDAANNLIGSMPERQNAGVNELRGEGVGGKIMGGVMEGALLGPVFMGPGLASLAPGVGMAGRMALTGADMAAKGALLSPEGQTAKGATVNAAMGAALPVAMIPGGVAGVKALESGASPLAASAIEGGTNALASGGMMAGLAAAEGGDTSDIVASGVVGGAMGAAAPKVGERIAGRLNDIGEPIPSEAPADASPPLPPGEPVPTLTEWHKEQLAHDKAVAEHTAAETELERVNAQIEVAKTKILPPATYELLAEKRAEATETADTAYTARTDAEEKLILARAKAEQKAAADAAKEQEKASKESESPKPEPEPAPESPKAEEPPPVEPNTQKPGRADMTGAEYSDPADATGIKNATVERERVKRNMPPRLEQAASDTFQEAWDSTLDRVAKDSKAGQRLVDDLFQNPRAIGKDDVALLTHRQIEAQIERDAATKAFLDLNGDVNHPGYADLENRAKTAQAELEKVYEVNDSVGRENSLGLGFRRMMARNDFSLAKMIVKLRVQKGGAKLTPEEHAGLERIADAVAKDDAMQAAAPEKERIAELEAQIEQMKKDAGINKAAPTSKKSAKTKTPKPSGKAYGKRNKLVSPERYEGAKAAYKQALKNLGLGANPIPVDAIKPLIEMGVFHLEAVGRGVASFAAWSAAMVKDAGDKIKPHLKELYDQTNREYQRRTREAIHEKLKATDPDDMTPDHIRTAAQRLARGFVSDGIHEVDPLTDAVHNELKRVLPDISKSNVQDAISGYGDFKQLNKSEIDAKLRDLKGQIQQLRKIEDMKSAKAPLKTGMERREPSDKERALIKQVNELMRRGGYKNSDPLKPVKKRLRNEISDLESQIAAREKIVPNKTNVKYDAETLALKAKRDSLKTEFDEIFGKNELTEQQRVDRALKALDRSIKELNQKIGDVDLDTEFKKPASILPEAKELKAKRAERDALRAELDVLKDIANPKKSPQEKALERRIKAKEKAIADRKERLKAGELGPKKVDRVEIPESKTLNDLQTDLDKLNASLRAERDKLKASPEQRALDAQIKAAEKAIADYEHRLTSGDLNPAKDAPLKLPDSPELDFLKEHLAKLKEAAAKRIKDALTDDDINDSALKAFKARTLRQISEYERRVADEDFDPKAKRELRRDTEANDIAFAAQQAKDKFLDAQFAYEQAKRSTGEKVFDKGKQTLNLFQSLMLGADYSMALLQGGIPAYANPIKWARAFRPSLEAWKSEQGRFNGMRDIMKRPNAENGIYKRAKLFFSDVGNSKVSKGEENFLGGWIKKFPIFGRFERAFSMFLNHLRADVFDGMHASLDNPTAKELEAIGHHVNVVTGRGGNTKPNALIDSYLGAANVLALAPRLLLSRLQYMAGPGRLLMPEGKSGYSPQVKKVIAKQFARALAGFGIATLLMDIVSDDGVEFDPRSSNFMSGRFGNTHLGLLPGFAPVIVLAARLISGQKKINGKIVPVEGYGGGAGTLILNFVRSKLRPMLGAAMDTMTRKDVVGRPITPASILWRNTHPITIEMIYDALRDQGLSPGGALGLLGWLGAPVRTDEAKRSGR